jgi:addiction module HigA family antidote
VPEELPLKSRPVDRRDADEVEIIDDHWRGCDGHEAARSHSPRRDRPGRVLRPLGVSINRLARDITVPPNRFSGNVNGKRSITAEPALRLVTCCGTSAETWRVLQSDFAPRMIRRTAGEAIAAQVWMWAA